MRSQILFVLLFSSCIAADNIDYDSELAKSNASGHVFWIGTRTRNSEFNITINNSKPELVILCCAPGLTQRSISSLWKTVTFQLYSTGETTMMYGDNASDVYHQWKQESGIIRFWFTPWKVDHLMVSPFRTTCIGAKSVDDTDISVRLTFVEIDLWLLTYFIVGLILFFSARRLSVNVVFHYGTGVTVGLLASVLILVFIISRFIPKKSAAYAVLALGFSLTAWLLQFIRQNVQTFLESYLQYIVIYLITAGLISFAVCYYKGPVTNPRLHDLIKWLLRLIAVGFIYNSSYMPELTVTVFCLIVVLFYVYQRLPVASTFDRYWKRWFPPKIHLLTEDEYIAQGIEETHKALQELRQYCRSPNCDSWKTVSRLSSPAQFASWIEGKSEHLSTSEIYEHEENPSPNLSFDSLTDADD